MSKNSKLEAIVNIYLDFAKCAVEHSLFEGKSVVCGELCSNLNTGGGGSTPSFNLTSRSISIFLHHHHNHICFGATPFLTLSILFLP